VSSWADSQTSPYISYTLQALGGLSPSFLPAKACDALAKGRDWEGEECSG